MSSISGKNRDPNQLGLDKQVRQPVTCIYFKKSSGNAMKRLATRIRDNGVQTRLAWAIQFKGPESINNLAKAVIIEQDVGNRALIAKSYERFAHNVEIHYVDSEGQFVELSEGAGHEDATTAVQGPDREVDPRDAVAALRAQSEVEPEPDPEPEQTEDEPEAVDSDSGEDDFAGFDEDTDPDRD